MLKSRHTFVLLSSLILTGCAAEFVANTRADGPATAPSAPTDASATSSTLPANLMNLSPEATLMLKDLAWLSDDAREGRGVGTRGLTEAGDFIADRFKTLGLQTVPGLDGYFQTFDMPVGNAPTDDTVLACNGANEKIGVDFQPIGTSGSGEFEGPVVFGGYGITNTAAKYDDYATLDVKDKVVLILRYEPRDEANKSKFTKNATWSRGSSFVSKARAAERKGAKAVLIVNPPISDAADTLTSVVNTGGGRGSGIPVVQITQKVADDLLAKGGAPDLKTLQKEIDGELKPVSADLKEVTVSGKVSFSKQTTKVRNIVAMLPGTTKKDEYLVIGAHSDHLGRGALGGSLSPGSTEIHNGADDNGSGTTGVLELARRLAKRGPLERNVVFILFTGEEEGLIGSEYFVAHSPIPLDKVVTMLNLDMIGRVRDEKILVGGSGTAAPFDGMLKELDAQLPINISYIGRGGFGPSDHASFAPKKIPVMFFFSGMHPDYHRPTDDWQKINYEGMSEVVDLSQKLLEKLDVMQPQEYIAKFDNEPALLSQESRGSTTRAAGDDEPRRASLGVIPDYGSDDSIKGVKISGTREGTPAAKAGLKADDLIIQINDEKISNLYDLTDFLSKAAPGDKVKITVMRGDKKVETEAELAERQG